MSQCVKLKFTKKKCAKFQNRRPRCDMRNSKQINLQLAEEKHNFPPESGSAARWRVLRGRSGRVRGLRVSVKNEKPVKELVLIYFDIMLFPKHSN